MIARASAWVICILALACAHVWAKPQVRRPNLIVILADDLGYGDLSCYGSKSISTPNLDKMAADGVRFTSFYASASICSPSRASLLTGRYAQRAGLPFVLFPTERKGLPPEEITIAELLKTNGYHTACIGKWHLGFLPEFRPNRQGFDYFFGLPYSNDSLKQPEDKAFDPVLAPVDLPLMRNDDVLEAPAKQETLTERYTEEAISFIEKHAKESFFLYLPHTFPHKPLHVSEKFRGKSRGGLYGDTVECVDWSVGQIIATLKRLEIDRETLVVFTSDNGPAPSGKKAAPDQGGGSAGPLRAGKFTSYEGGFRVPGIFLWPGKIPTGRSVNAVVTTMDIFPTFCVEAGIRTPQNLKLDGKNIWPLLTDQKARSPHDVFCYYLDNQLQAVRVGEWKLVLRQSEFPRVTTIFYTNRLPVLEKHFPLRESAELYDLNRDVSESTNVAAANPGIVSRLSRIAAQFDSQLKKSARPEALLP